MQNIIYYHESEIQEALIMLTIPMIKNFIAEIADKYELTKVELFGSYAKGRTSQPGFTADHRQGGINL